jgi:hypothetical protein
VKGHTQGQDAKKEEKGRWADAMLSNVFGWFASGNLPG